MASTHAMNHHHHPPRGTPKKHKKSTTAPVGVDSISALPDAILVHIGKTVANLCGVRDFARLSHASRRLKALLINSEETVAEVLRKRTAQIEDSSISSTRIVLRTLEQLALYESCCGCYGDDCVDKEFNLFEKNLVTATDVDQDEADDLVEAVQAILKRNPSSSVILDLHSASQNDGEHPWYRKLMGAILEHETCYTYDYRWGPACMPKDLEQRLCLRYWEEKVTEIASKSDPWIEIFLRIESPRRMLEPSTTHLELPPRPCFYENLIVSERIYLVDSDCGMIYHVMTYSSDDSDNG